MGYHTKDAEPKTAQLNLTFNELEAITATAIFCKSILRPTDTEKHSILTQILNKSISAKLENFKD